MGATEDNLLAKAIAEAKIPELDSDARSGPPEDVANPATEVVQKRREKQGKARPMWSVTEDQAKLMTEQKDEDDLGELLEFAKNLDYEKYIDDMEVQTMIDQVKQRIDELEMMNEDEVAAQEVK